MTEYKKVLDPWILGIRQDNPHFLNELMVT